jgi:hypothetical protein
MNDVLAICGEFPEKRLTKGDCLIEEEVRTDRPYVIKRGAFEVVRNGVRVILISEPGAFLGEFPRCWGPRRRRASWPRRTVRFT